MAKTALRNIKQGLQSRFSFGKYKRRIIQDIAQEDPSYIFWVRDNVSWFPLAQEVIDMAEEWRPDKGGAEPWGNGVDGWGEYDDEPF